MLGEWSRGSRSGTVAVEYDEQTVNVDQIKAAIEDQGYDVV